MTGPDHLRLDIARSHGLPDDGTPFLSGETIDQIEASAAALVKLTGSRPEPTPAPAANPFTRGPGEKAARQRQLLAALHAPVVQPRDEHGRYATTTRGGSDGGARTPAPAPRDPNTDHDALITRLAEVNRTHHHGW